VVRHGVVGGSTVVELLDAEVREEVRRSGVDRLVDADAVRRSAHSAVAGHDQRSPSGVVARSTIPMRWSRSWWHEWRGSGRCSGTSTSPGSLVGYEVGVDGPSGGVHQPGPRHRPAAGLTQGVTRSVLALQVGYLPVRIPLP
jgi:hypothetical protein